MADGGRRCRRPGHRASLLVVRGVSGPPPLGPVGVRALHVAVVPALVDHLVGGGAGDVDLPRPHIAAVIVDPAEPADLEAVRVGLLRDHAVAADVAGAVVVVIARNDREVRAVDGDLGLCLADHLVGHLGVDGEHAVVDAVPLLNGVVEGADEGLVGLVDGAVADLDVLVALLGQLEVDADEPAQLLAEGEANGVPGGRVLVGPGRGDVDALPGLDRRRVVAVERPSRDTRHLDGSRRLCLGHRQRRPPQGRRQSAGHEGAESASGRRTNSRPTTQCVCQGHV